MGKRLELDFEKDLGINKYKLDEECLSHSVLYYRYGELLADAKNEVGVLTDALKLKMGEANTGIRNRFIQKDQKFTEAVITSEVEKDTGVIEAREDLRKAELTYARLQAGVSAFEHRKSQLDNLVKLYVSGYFSTPSPGGTKETINDQAGKDARLGLNKNRKHKPHIDDEDDDE